MNHLRADVLQPSATPRYGIIRQKAVPKRRPYSILDGYSRLRPGDIARDLSQTELDRAVALAMAADEGCVAEYGLGYSPEFLGEMTQRARENVTDWVRAIRAYPDRYR